MKKWGGRMTQWGARMTKCDAVLKRRYAIMDHTPQIKNKHIITMGYLRQSINICRFIVHNVCAFFITFCIHTQ
jgi:hypothetical protein